MLYDTEEGQAKSLIEEKLRKEKAAPAAGNTLGSAENQLESLVAAARGQAGQAEAGGAAAAAGVLTAVDEDEEGAEEAEVPRDFEYFSENEEES